MRKLYAGIILLALSSVPASASILTFNSVGDYAILTNYGSNMTGLCTGSGQAGCVSEGNGFTPDIAVSFSTVGAVAFMDEWTAGYGDLPAAGYADRNNHLADITLTPQNGATLILNSFDLAGFGSDIAGQTVEVLSADQTVLWSASGTVSGAGPSHSSYSPDITSTTALQIVFGPNYNVGIDNVNFDETTTPEPSAWTLLALGLGAVVLKRRSQAARSRSAVS